MKALFPPLADKASLPRRVLCIAPHSDDEVFGCGGLLAYHAARGDEVRVVVLTDGSAGDPDHAETDIAEARRRESRAAGEKLGVHDHRFLALPDGGLAGIGDLEAILVRELDAFQPELVYGPSPQEMHPDHRATSRALLAALAQGPSRRVFLYGVNAQVTAGILFDTTAEWPRKLAAIQCFESQLRYHDLVTKAEAVDRARTVNIEDKSIEFVEGFADLRSEEVLEYEARVAGVLAAVLRADDGPEPVSRNGHASARPRTELPAATAVISTWNKRDVVIENVESLLAQTLPFESIVVVDNASTDGTAEAIAERFPEVRLIVMPHSRYGACETFNIGFASVTTPLLAILDDDVTLPPDWLEKCTKRLVAEPPTTAVLSTKVVEPGMPESYKTAPAVNKERYMSTFRGCGSLAWTKALREAGFYDERLFIYGNERDLTCRLLALDYRVLQYPAAETYHKTPFGVQMGKRSLYYHARNAWLTMIKHAPLPALLRMPWLVLTRVLLRSSKTEAEGTVTDAVGTIGIGRSLRETPGASLVVLKAAGSVLWNLPYCLKHRQPVRSSDFELPIR